MRYKTQRESETKKLEIDHKGDIFKPQGSSSVSPWFVHASEKAAIMSVTKKKQTNIWLNSAEQDCTLCFYTDQHIGKWWQGAIHNRLTQFELQYAVQKSVKATRRYRNILLIEGQYFIPLSPLLSQLFNTNDEKPQNNYFSIYTELLLSNL